MEFTVKLGYLGSKLIRFLIVKKKLYSWVWPSTESFTVQYCAHITAFPVLF